MRNVIGDPIGAPRVQWLEIPTVKNRRTPHPFIFPHELFGCFFKMRYRINLWNQAIIGKPGENIEFWRSVADTDFVRRHPYLTDALFSKSIPIGLHGDGRGGI